MSRKLQRKWGLALAGALICVAAAPAAERLVLCEEFTWTNCYYCGFAGPALDMMVDNHPDTFALVQIHVIDGYATAWGNDRAEFYGVPGTPTAEFDGVIEVVGSYTNINYQYNSYNNRYSTRRAVPTDVTIDLVADDQGNGTFVVRARVAVEEDGVAKPMRVHIVQVLDNWPVSPSYHRYGFKQAATAEDVTVEPAAYVLVERTFTLDSYSQSHMADVKFVAWAQVPNPTQPAEVYQCAVMHWPFPADCNANGVSDARDLAEGAAQDCNVNGVPDECDIADGQAHDGNDNGVPDSCEMLPGDMDCSFAVDFGDINPFVLALTDPAGYSAAFPACERMNADLDGNGAVNFADINPFVIQLTGGE